MNARAFIAECRRRGGTLEIDSDGELIADLPEELDKPKVWAHLRGHLREIRGLLAADASPTPPEPEPEKPPEAAQGPAPPPSAFSFLAAPLTTDELPQHPTAPIYFGTVGVQWQNGAWRDDEGREVPRPRCAMDGEAPPPQSEPELLRDPFEPGEVPDLLYLHQMAAEIHAGTFPPGPADTRFGEFNDPGAVLLDTWRQVYEMKQAGDLDGAEALAAVLTCLIDWWHDARLQVHNPETDGITAREAFARLPKANPAPLPPARAPTPALPRRRTRRSRERANLTPA